MGIIDRVIEYVAGAQVQGAYNPTTPFTGTLPTGRLKKGSRGSDVKHLQQFLNWSNRAGLVQDGIFGKKTASGLRKWQRRYGLKADAIWGSQSRRKAQSIVKAHAVKKPAAKPVSTNKNAAKIVARAKEYCWPYGTDPKKYAWSTGSAKPAYKAALKKYMGKSARVSQTDCGYFASTCVMGAGLAKPKSFNCLEFKAPPATMQIVHKGKKIPDGFLKAGDVIRYKKKSGQHAMVYMGDGKIAEAQRSGVKVGKNFPAIKKDTKKYNKSNVKYSTIQVLRAR